jgi:hypothetical protein
MISLGDLVANFVDTLFVLAWNYLLTLCRCIFMVRSGLYRTLVRGYRTRPNRIGLGTLSFISILVCYTLFPYVQGPLHTTYSGDVFTQAEALRKNDRIFVYLLGGFALFTLASFFVTRVGLSLARCTRTTRHWQVDEFRLLRFFPHLAVSTSSVLVILIAICISKLMLLANIWGYDAESVRQKLAWIGLLLLGTYTLIIWPRQGLLLYRKSARTQRFQKQLAILGTLLLSSILPFYLALQLTRLAFEQSEKIPPPVGPTTIGLDCDYSLEKGYSFYVKARNSGTTPVLIRQLA